MKKVQLITVGKIKEDYLKAGIAEYLKRLSAYASVTIVEIPDSANFGHEKVESEAIAAKIAGYSVLFDIEGRQVDSSQFAALLDKPYLNFDTVTLIIGGSNGVTDELRKKVNERIGMGKVTYPHQLMRLMVLEQIYRGFNILANTPYHK